MRLTSEAHVPTRHGGQYLADLCRRLEQRAQPEVRVECNEGDGRIEFGWAGCTLRADKTGLSLHAEADDEEALAQVCELIARHVETHADETFTVSWSHEGAVATHAERRDRMRAFHARMRHR